MLSATLVGAASALFSFACTIPQMRKLRALKTAAGVSVAALANSTISGIAWTVYGLWRHDVWVTLPAILGLPATAVSLVLAWQRGGSRARMWLPVVWTGLIAVAAAVSPWAGTAAITAILGFSIALMVAPAAVTAWRSHDVSALAANAWLLLITDAVIAGTYGFLADVTANILYAAVALAGSAAVLIRLMIPSHVHHKLVPAAGRDAERARLSQREIGCAA